MVFPTDTVWGVGVCWDQAGAVAKLYNIKQRQNDKHFALLIADINQLALVRIYFELLSEDLRVKAEKLMAAFWPGGLTPHLTVVG